MKAENLIKETNDHMILLTRQYYKNHPILSSIIQSIDDEDFEGAYDIRKISDILKYLKSKKTTIICADPIVFILASILSPFKKKIFFSLEMYEFQAFNKGVNIVRNFIFKVCHFLALKFSDKIVFSNKSRYRFYLFKKWVRSEKSYIVENTPSSLTLQMMDGVNKLNKLTLKKNIFEKYNIPVQLLEKNIFVYSGSLSLGRGRGILELIQLFSKREDEILIIAGNDQKEVLKKLVTDNVFFVGQLAKVDSLKLVKITDFQIAFYSEKLINTRLCAPVKLYESIYLNVPILVNESPGILSLSICNHLNIYKNLQQEILFSQESRIKDNACITSIEKEIRKVIYN